jgi:SAM-dependent methyltransferase
VIAEAATQRDPLYSYWGKEAASFQAFCEANPGATYRDWQPTKWQSLGRVADAVIQEAARRGTPIESAVELGCGSATLLVQFACRGIRGIGVDGVYTALQLARAAAESVDRSDDIALLCADFLALGDADVPAADLVCSGGVIEHWDTAGQLRVLDIHRSLTSRWLLVGVPNLESPVFKSFVRWARAHDRFYSDEHFEISVPELAACLGMPVVWEDGCHIFLGRSDYYQPGDAELDAFYADLTTQLLAFDPVRFAGFPQVDLTAEEVETLAAVEEAVDPTARRRFGFMTFYLLDAG